jgi:hypothetical protein
MAPRGIAMAPRGIAILRPDPRLLRRRQTVPRPNHRLPPKETRRARGGIGLTSRALSRTRRGPGSPPASFALLRRHFAFLAMPSGSVEQRSPSVAVGLCGYRVDHGLKGEGSLGIAWGRISPRLATGLDRDGIALVPRSARRSLQRDVHDSRTPEDLAGRRRRQPLEGRCKRLVWQPHADSTAGRP